MNWFDKYGEKRLLFVAYLSLQPYMQQNLRNKIKNFDAVTHFEKIDVEEIMKKSNLRFYLFQVVSKFKILNKN